MGFDRFAGLRMLVNDFGTIVKRYTYDLYGNVKDKIEKKNWALAQFLRNNYNLVR